jgi:hypothetical protein
MFVDACDHGPQYEDYPDEETGELVMIAAGDCDCPGYVPAVQS